MKAIFLRTENNYDLKKASDECAVVPVGDSLTNQSEAADADINTLVRRFGLTHQLPTNVRVPMWGDFTDLTDYRGALDAVKAADDAFMAMPAEVRSRFGNDAAAFVDFCSDPANLDEMRKLGLAVPKVAAPAASVSNEPKANA